MTISITNGQVILPDHVAPESVSLWIEGEKFVTRNDSRLSEQAIEADGMIVAPGIIDLGVFKTDKPAFRFGGITRAALMPDQSPVHDDPATIRYAALKGKPDFWVHPLAAATNDLDGLHMAEIALMKDAGARAVATGRQWIADSGIICCGIGYASICA
jgi:dihydroorotase